MKITRISAIPASPGTTAHPMFNFPPWNYVFVKVETDEGIVGWGDATCGPTAVASLVEEYGGMIVGEDPFRIEELWQTIHHRYFTRGGPIQNSAQAGIEMALYDIKGKALGVPVYELLGGKMRDLIWTYGRWDGPSPESAAEFALSQLELGFTALKGDPFDHRGLFISYEAEKKAIDTLAAVRDAVGFEVELLVEVHGRLTPAEAIRIGNEMEQYRPFVYEEPVPFENIDAMEQVARGTNIPIATGERIYSPFTYFDLLQRQIVAMIQPDMIQTGGIGQMKRIAALAEAQYVGVQPHAIHGPMEVLAALHVDRVDSELQDSRGRDAGLVPGRVHRRAADAHGRLLRGARGAGSGCRDRRGLAGLAPAASRTRLGARPGFHALEAVQQSRLAVSR